MVSELEQELIEACMDNKIDRVYDALQKGVNVNVQDNRQYGYKRTPLHRASYNGHKEIVEIVCATWFINHTIPLLT
jgi:hypothetical protein